jgi:exonuclease-1
MGITGLLPLLKECINTKAHIREFTGQRVAVDGYAWLHRSVHACAVELAKGQHSEKWVYYILTYVDMLIAHNITVVLVFDGAELVAKQGTENSRALKRQLAFSRAQSLEEEGKSKDAYSFYAQSVDVSPRMAAQLIRTLRRVRPGVHVLVSPFEADAQLAFLARNGHVDAVISEDSDCIPYECPSIIFKLDRDGSCQSLKLAQLHATRIKGFDLRNFTPLMVLVLCVTAGCDYLPSVKNYGIKKAYDVVSRRKTATQVLKAMRISGCLPHAKANLQPPGNNNSNIINSNSCPAAIAAGDDADAEPSSSSSSMDAGAGGREGGVLITPRMGALGVIITPGGRESGFAGTVTAPVDQRSISSSGTNTTNKATAAAGAGAGSDPGPIVSPTLLQYVFCYTIVLPFFLVCGVVVSLLIYYCLLAFSDTT